MYNYIICDGPDFEPFTGMQFAHQWCRLIFFLKKGYLSLLEPKAFSSKLSAFGQCSLVADNTVHHRTKHEQTS